jgi:hypothetical protein
MNGGLDELLSALQTEYQAEELAAQTGELAPARVRAISPRADRPHARQ